MSDAGPPNPLRELLFADLAPGPARETFARGGAATRYIVELADAAEARDVEAARLALARVPGAERETRMHLQAWTLARMAGVDPGDGGAEDAGAREVLGVVVDVGLDAGLDTLAGYLDGSARYLNHAGGAVVWEVPDADVGRLVRSLLDAATVIVDMGAPLDGPRLGPPHAGNLMLSVLTRGGSYVGAGPSEAIAGDPRGGPVLNAATALMTHLVDRSMQARGRDGAG